MRILMSAYACEPNQGSEPAVGWHWAMEASAAGHDVWVVTRRNNQPSIEAALATMTGPVPAFEYCDLPRFVRKLKARFGHPGLLAYYYLWQVALVGVARRLHRRHRFDLAHHVTFVNDTMPSGLCLLRIPFIWGPVGGSSHHIPPEVELDLPAYARRHERVRAGLQFVFQKLDPFVLLTRRRACVILTYTDEALVALPRRARRAARAIVHIGVSPTDPVPRPVPHVRGPGSLRILTGGRLVHWKGQDLLIEGFAEFVRSFPDTETKLVVTGEGPYGTYLAKLAQREGVASRVEFLGRLATRDDVVNQLHQADLFALPTLRDGPPVALLEAMACGLPVLCLDVGASAELVPSEAGIKIAPRSREYIVSEIARGLAWAASNPVEAEAMGAAGRRHVLERHDWHKVGLEIDRTYREAARLSS